MATKLKTTSHRLLKLHDFLFHYNVYTEKWNKIPRVKISDYWNGKKDGIKESKDIFKLILDTK